jgi:hypothetical protein
MRLVLSMFVVAAIGFGAGYAVFRTRTGAAVAAVVEVAGWRLESVVAADQDHRESGQKVDELFALAAKPPSLAQARALYAAIEAMNAQDFRALGADPAALAARFEKVPFDLRHMIADAMMDRWLRIDEEGALAWVKSARLVAEAALKPEQKLESKAFDGLVAALARHRPDWLFDLSRETAANAGRATAIESAMWRLAERDPADALRRLAMFDQEDDRRAAAQGLVRGWARVDPVAAAGFALSLTDADARYDALRTVMFAAGDRSGASVAEVFHVLPENERRYIWPGLSYLALERPAAARQLLETLVSQDHLAAGDPYDTKDVAVVLGTLDPVATVNWIDGWSEEMRLAMCPSFREVIVEVWTVSDPAAALAWAIAQSPQQSTTVGTRAEGTIDDLFQGAFRGWLSVDRAAVLAWIDTQPAGAVRDSANCELARNLLNNGDVSGAALAYAAGAAKDSRGEIAQRLAEALAKKDAAAAADWSRSLPDGAARFNAIKSATSVWLARDWNAAVAWFEKLPTGADHDASATALVIATSEDNAGAAAEWIAQIADPKARADAAVVVFGAWNSTDPQGARSWLRELQGVDEHWKETFLRRVR